MSVFLFIGCALANVVTILDILLLKTTPSIPE
jgi:hypothetical protein